MLIILLLIISIIGLTYSWFSATITGNDTAKENVVTTGVLKIVYTNGEEIKGDSIEPGWSETKTFTVENTGTVEAVYNINWKYLTNTFVNKQDLVLTLTSTNSGGTLPETQISNSGTHINILKNITIAPGVAQEYTMTITYKNQNYDQSSDMGKELSGKIEVLDANEEVEDTAADTIISKATEGNTEGLIKLEQPGTGQTKAQTEYRYSGSNDVVKNHVNFNNEVWRIIGVFLTEDASGNIENRVKIIREESIGNYSWDSSDTSINSGSGINQWGESGSYNGADLMRLLNPGYEGENVNNSLYWNRGNGTCYNYTNNATTTCDFTSIGLTEEAKGMIEDAVWYTATSSYDVTASESYKEERGSAVGSADTGITITKTTNWIDKMGLMYPSDYGYASSGCMNGEQTLYNYSNTTCKDTNWLYNNTVQWTLSSASVSNYFVHFIYSTGLLFYDNISYSYGVRPVTFLASSVKIVGGDGTSNNPYELSL